MVPKYPFVVTRYYRPEIAANNPPRNSNHESIGEAMAAAVKLARDGRTSRVTISVVIYDSAREP